MKILIVIPAYNEAENIAATVSVLQKECPEYSYVVINDGSRDRSEEHTLNSSRIATSRMPSSA